MPPLRTSLQKFNNKAKPYLPKEKNNFQNSYKTIITKCNITNCPCKQEQYTNANPVWLDTLFHACPTRHHKSCHIIQR